MDWLQNVLYFIRDSLFQEVVAVLAGLLFAVLVRRTWIEWRYGRWHVVLVQGGETRVDRKISAEKARQVLAESSELSTFLKGVISPWALLKIDIIEHGERTGILKRDLEKRVFTLDLDANPNASKPLNPEEFLNR
jgi:hypothetical protein